VKDKLSGYNAASDELTKTTIDLEPPTNREEQADYEVEFVNNQNRIMSLWNEIVQ
jgi:hypothetical protein